VLKWIFNFLSTGQIVMNSTLQIMNRLFFFVFSKNILEYHFTYVLFNYSPMGLVRIKKST
jgi:hypothetical protein